MRAPKLWRTAELLEDAELDDRPVGVAAALNAPSSRRRVRRMLGVSDWVLASLAVLFLVAYAVPILAPQIPAVWNQVCNVVQLVTWGFFALDYVTRLFAARNRRRYFVRHLLDLLIVALPFLRPLRLVVLFRVLNRRATSAMQGRVATYVTVSAATLVFCAALAVLDAERSAPGSNITNFGNAIWWAVVTVTTVGYGDHFPVTLQGRFIAVGLMIGGVALIGVVTASFAAWFISRVRVGEDEQASATQQDIHEVMARLDVVTAELVELRKSAARAEQRARAAERELSPP